MNFDPKVVSHQFKLKYRGEVRLELRKQAKEEDKNHEKNSKNVNTWPSQRWLLGA